MTKTKTIQNSLKVAVASVSMYGKFIQANIPYFVFFFAFTTNLIRFGGQFLHQVVPDPSRSQLRGPYFVFNLHKYTTSFNFSFVLVFYLHLK
jgi:hypothetical protein